MDVQFLPSAQTIFDAQAQSARAAESSNPSGETFHQALCSASSENGKVAENGNVAGAAKQFEALIAGQVLKSVRDASQGGWLGNDDDQTGELTLEMGEQAFAQALANRGAFGIAKIVSESLERGHPKTASSGPDSSSPQALPSKDAPG